MTSIIILSYNTKELTQLCIQSIRRYTKRGSYEIIVVENASTDGSLNWLRGQPDLRLIINTENAGFPKGCNQGMKIAVGSEILLLNSDVIVTPRWLEQLRTALYSQAEVGAVSCVTNVCTNGQKIDVPYGSDLAAMQDFADAYNHTEVARWQLSFKLIGFCFLFRREVYERIGGLDERFSPGNYEDDDYSLRIRQAGWKLLICRDTFIHHFGRSSFVKAKNKEMYESKRLAYNDLLLRNKQYFLKKWNLSEHYDKSHPFMERLPCTGEEPCILLLGGGVGLDPYVLQWRFPKAKICVVMETMGDVWALAPDFAANYCADIKREVLLQLRGTFDCIIYCEDLADFDGRDSFIQGMRPFMTDTGQCLYNVSGKMFRFGVASA